MIENRFIHPPLSFMQPRPSREISPLHNPQEPVFRNESSNLTAGQSEAANIAFYLGFLDILSEASEDYRVWKSNKDGQDSPGIKQQAEIAFADLYFARKLHDNEGNFEGLVRFWQSWGEESYVFQNLLDQKVQPKIQRLQEETLENASMVTTKDKLLITMKALQKMPGFSEEQRDHVLNLAGYTAEERRNMRIRLGISAGISAGVGLAYEASTTIVTGYYGFNPFLEEFPDKNAVAVVAASYLAYLSSLAVNTQQNVRLLRNKHIHMSPNITATIAYYLLKKLFPQNERVQTIGTWAGSVGFDMLKTAGWFTTTFIPDVGPSIITSINLVGTAYNAIPAAIAQGALLYKTKDKDQNDPSN